MTCSLWVQANRLSAPVSPVSHRSSLSFRYHFQRLARHDEEGIHGWRHTRCYETWLRRRAGQAPRFVAETRRKLDASSSLPLLQLWRCGFCDYGERNNDTIDGSALIKQCHVLVTRLPQINQSSVRVLPN